MTQSRATRWGAILLGVWGSQAWTFAQAVNSPAVADVPAVGYSVLRVLGALLIVLAVFFGGIWLFKNWQRRAAPRGAAPKLAILEIKSLSNRHALYVVGYEKQRLLLVSSPTGVTLVSQLPEASAAAEPTSVSPGFAATLQGVLNRNP